MAVRVKGALNLVGALVKWYSLALLFPTSIAIMYGESPWPFVVPGVAAGVLGYGVERSTSGKEGIGAREGFLVVTLVWLLVPALGALPYLLSGDPQLRNPVDALFESMSGFTTTGSSVLTDIPALNHSLLMWRQFTQWIGGMGIVVLGLAVLPRLRVGGRRAVFEAESPGPDAALTESILTVARRFLGLYVGITFVLVAVLAVLGWTRLDREMTFFDAVAHAFTTIPTGGFSPRARSIEEFGAATQWAIIPFMILGGTSFVLLYAAIIRQRPRALAHDDEFRAYGFVLTVASVIILADIVGAGIVGGELAVRQAVFNTVSVFTTTGFANADFNEWTALTTFVLVGGMILSASAGSTAGGIKLVRHVLIAKSVRRELVQTVHPELVVPIRLSGTPVDERAVRGAIMFALIYVGVLVAGALVILVDSAASNVPLSAFDSVAATATTLASVGPGFGFAGPMGSFEPFSDVSKVVLIALMWMGRFEILPILVLLSRSYWRS